MNNSPSSHERIHALDSLRAVMMMLGLVLHSALTYSVTDYGDAWSLKDPNATNYFMDWLSGFIHVFRMPIFFVVAGFFGALLFYKRGAHKMFKNRMARIFFPFNVFLFLLWPTIVFSFSYTRAVFADAANPLSDTLSIFSNPLVFLPSSTFHLWFLYYLLMITLASFGIGLLIKQLPKFSSRIKGVFDSIAQKPFLKLMVFSSLTFLLLYLMGSSWVATSTSFIPDLKTFSFYSFFYIFGWVLYKSKQPLEQLPKFSWLFTILGVVLFTLKFTFLDSAQVEFTMAINAVTVWLLSFGITGLFIKYGSNHSAKMRYISDASYWVYLLHLPLTAVIPGLISNWNLPATIKFLIVLVLSLIICFVSYQYLVRDSFIGKFLNGRRYPKTIKIENTTVELKKAS